MKNLIQAIAIAASILLGASACVQAARPDVAASDERSMRSIKRPNTPSELLRNVKWAVDEQALLDREFYEEKYLKFFANARSLGRSSIGSDISIYELSGLDDVLQKNPHYPIDPYIELVIPHGDAQRLSKTTLTIAPEGDARFTVEQVQAVFGPAHEIIDAVAASATRTPAMANNGGTISPQPLLDRGPVTHRLGAKDLRWQIRNETVQTQIAAKIGGDGLVWELSVEQGEN